MNGINFKEVGKVKKLIFFMVISLVLSMFFSTANANDVVRLGVMKFENRASGLSEQQAAAVTDIFTYVMANTKIIAPIEREQLEAIGREHKINMSGLVDPKMALEVGKLAGCEYMIFGAVTQLDEEAHETRLGKYLTTHSLEAHATIYARIVNVNTGEVVLSDSASASARKSGSDLGTSDAGVTSISLSSAKHEAVTNTAMLLAKKVREAIRKDIGGEAPHVISVNGKEVRINQGASSGLMAGDLYRVYSEGKEITDTDGTVLDREIINIAVLQVQDVYPNYSTARVYNISGFLSSTKKGGKVELIQPNDMMSFLTEDEAENLMSRKGTFISSRPKPQHSSETQKAIEQLEASVRGGNTTQNVPAASDNNGLAAPTGKGVTAPKREFENQSTEPSKVIMTYGLPSGDSNTRRIEHINARKLGNTKKAYEKYVELANSYSGDYLAAFRAGEIAKALGDKDGAKTWFEKALAINPSYEPAQKAKESLEKAPQTVKKRSKKRK